MPEEISAIEAARKLGVGLDYVYALVWVGKLSARKVDGRWLVDSDSVAARLSKSQPTAPAHSRAARSRSSASDSAAT